MTYDGDRDNDHKLIDRLLITSMDQSMEQANYIERHTTAAVNKALCAATTAGHHELPKSCLSCGQTH